MRLALKHQAFKYAQHTPSTFQRRWAYQKICIKHLLTASYNITTPHNITELR